MAILKTSAVNKHVKLLRKKDRYLGVFNRLIKKLEKLLHMHTQHMADIDGDYSFAHGKGCACG